MSGSGASSKKRVSGRGQGWEEAGAEFYSESYPNGADIELDVFQRDPSHIATLLPSKQSRVATTKQGPRNTDTRTFRRRTSTRSRQSTARRTSTVNQDVHVAMMPDLSENLSNEQRTWEEIMQIKAMPIPMYQKKEMKAKLQNATYLRLQGYEQFKWQQRKAWQQVELRWNEVLSKIELWKYSLKKIEGNFGTGIVAYFLFLKWLMFLNLVIFILILVFIILPTIFFYSNEKYECDNEWGNSTNCCSQTYYDKFQSLSPSIIDFIQGTGWMEYTLMFYGFYSNKIYSMPLFSTSYDIPSEFVNVSRNLSETSELVSANETSESKTNLYYDLPIAYMAVTIGYFMLSLAAIVKSAARGFKERLVEGEGQFYHYCNIIFGGWDFCINNEKSANIKHKALYNEIKGSLEAERLEEERQSRTRDEKLKLFFVRTIINFLIVVLLIGSGVLIYFIFEFSMNKLLRSEISPDSDSMFNSAYLEILFLQFLPSLSIVGLNILLPEVFKSLVKLENYSPEFVVKISLVRTVFLRLSSLGVLLMTLYTLVSCSLEEGDICSSRKCKTPLCWESYVGQQIYKLILTDFATHLLLTFFVNFPRAMIAKNIDNKCAKIIGHQEFELPKHVLDVVYSQTLCWLGTFYSPMIPALAAIGFFLMFYIKKFACLVNCSPSSTVYRASRSNSLFMFVLLLSFVVSVIPVGLAIAELTPSKSCGPFRGLVSVWTIVLDTFAILPSWIQSILFFFGTAGFAVPMFILLTLSLYYYYAVSAANKHMVVVLKNQLVLEGHDKQFLLNRLSAFIKQQQEYQKKIRNSEMQRERERERERERINSSSN